MIQKNLNDSLCKIRQAALRAGRDPERIKLVAVSKNHSVSKIKAAISAGQSVFGESRIQEAAAKIPDIRYPVEWHLIGHLQSNKAKQAVQLFDCIHSVDSLKILAEIDRCARKISKIQSVLIQVNIAEETTKFGVPASLLPKLIEAATAAGNICLAGLMTIPPYSDNAEDARPYFRRLREIAFDELIAKHYIKKALLELSMGMSGDYEVAIEEGATMVRVGTAVFGART
jgi:PLP dependent protein